MWFDAILIMALLFFLLVVVYIILKRRQAYNGKNNKKSNISNNSNKSEKHGLQLQFVEKRYFEDVIDNSQYFYRMNQADLLARNIGSIAGYIKLYKDGLREFTAEEKELLTSLTNKIDGIIKERCNRIGKIPWKFAKVDSTIENGWPHTLSDIIVLSPRFFQGMNPVAKEITLLHEKIHVYQRMFPIETHNLISDRWGFNVINRIEAYQLARNNPDINNFVYSKNGEAPFLQLYNSDHPKGIEDSSVFLLDPKNEKPAKQITKNDLGVPEIVSQYEHPYEIMATLLPRLVLENYKESNKMIDDAYEWMQSKGC